MSPNEEIRITCILSRGGFPSERIFKIPSPQGGKYVGMAYIGYCYNENNERLEEEEPPAGKEIKGLLVCRFIQDVGGFSLIQTPDGELCEIENKLILELNDVLVGS